MITALIVSAAHLLFWMYIVPKHLPKVRDYFEAEKRKNAGKSR